MALRTNYVLVDYENVQPDALALLADEHFKVIVFVGANQTKVTFEAAEALQRMGNKAEYIKISGNGPNALDFHIAFYIGELARNDPTPYFHILSKDAGFDPLIKHLKTRNVLVSRWRNVADIPLIKMAEAKSPQQKLELVVANLQQRGTSKPRAVKTLSSTINSLFQKQLSEQDLTTLVEGLRKKGYIQINGTKVSYNLPEMG